MIFATILISTMMVFWDFITDTVNITLFSMSNPDTTHLPNWLSFDSINNTGTHTHWETTETISSLCLMINFFASTLQLKLWMGFFTFWCHLLPVVSTNHIMSLSLSVLKGRTIIYFLASLQSFWFSTSSFFCHLTPTRPTLPNEISFIWCLRASKFLFLPSTTSYDCYSTHSYRSLRTVPIPDYSTILVPQRDADFLQNHQVSNQSQNSIAHIRTCALSFSSFLPTSTSYVILQYSTVQASTVRPLVQPPLPEVP